MVSEQADSVVNEGGVESSPEGVTVLGELGGRREEILSPEALAFLATLTRRFRPELEGLLQARAEAQQRFDRELPDFLPETEEIRRADWKVAPLPEDLLDRRVEITGPVDRKMVINALNSGASCFMADLEDSNSPTWDNCIDGQVNLRDAVNRTIRFVRERDGKVYSLVPRPAVLLVRPRGLHLVEKHLLVDGEPVPASLFDFGLFFFHNAHTLLDQGSGPYFYLPKLEHHLEARWWNEVFLAAQGLLGIAAGTIKATMLLETLPAAFQMDELLYELREHSAGLNCGRWDYIFSYIKTLQAWPDKLLPDRAQVGMTQPFMAAYTSRVIAVCHRRGVHAMGGMAAQIPIKGDPVRNAEAIDKVRHDKLREVQAGHDGTWVAHPGLVSVAREVFDAHMPGPNQLHVLREDVVVGPEELLARPAGSCTREGITWNARVGLQYLEAWLRGSGCVPLYDLMEDAATAEISRAQLWQQVRHGARLEDGSTVTADEVVAVIRREARDLSQGRHHGQLFDAAADIFVDLVTAERCPPFLTLPAYERLP